MTLRRFIFSFITVSIGLYVGLAYLPYTFSEQKPLVMSELSGEYDPRETGEYLGEQVVSTRTLETYLAMNDVLGETSTSNKRIEIDLTNQRLYAYEGSHKVYDFLISSGKWGKTPTGVFSIWIKLRYTKMEGGSKALNTYYYLPNVPYTMFFSNKEIPAWRGFGIHGAYWHNNFGHPMSHGCINMNIEEAGQLFSWAEPDLMGKASIRATTDNPGTTVIIYGKAPNY